MSYKTNDKYGKSKKEDIIINYNFQIDLDVCHMLNCEGESMVATASDISQSLNVIGPNVILNPNAHVFVPSTELKSTTPNLKTKDVYHEVKNSLLNVNAVAFIPTLCNVKTMSTTPISDIDDNISLHSQPRSLETAISLNDLIFNENASVCMFLESSFSDFIVLSDQVGTKSMVLSEIGSVVNSTITTSNFIFNINAAPFYPPVLDMDDCAPHALNPCARIFFPRQNNLSVMSYDITNIDYTSVTNNNRVNCVIGALFATSFVLAFMFMFFIFPRKLFAKFSPNEISIDFTGTLPLNSVTSPHNSTAVYAEYKRGSILKMDPLITDLCHTPALLSTVNPLHTNIRVNSNRHINLVTKTLNNNLHDSSSPYTI